MFKLNIESSRDIIELHINFADGTSSTVTNESLDNTKPRNQKTKQDITQQKEHKRKNLQDYLDTELDSDNSQTTQDVVELPVIEELNRPPRITDELQNLDI